jgi:urea transport system ATP-binding protein
MHQGRLLKEGSVAEIRADAEVAAVYLGRTKHDAAA